MGASDAAPAPADELVAADAAAGSRAAFEELVERYADRVVAVLERRVGDHHRALDLAQEVWVRVFHALARFRTDESFRSWLFSIALNASRDELRRRDRARVHYVEEVHDAPGARPVGDPAERAATRSAVDAAIAGVAEPFRTALVVVDVAGLSYEEAATSLRCAVGTVKSRVNRGRLAFRDHWTRLQGEAAPEASVGELT